MRNKKGRLAKHMYKVLICAFLLVLLTSCAKDVMSMQKDEKLSSQSIAGSEQSYGQDVSLIDLDVLADNYTLVQAEADGLVICSYNDAGEQEMSDGGERWAKFKRDVTEGTPSAIQYALDLGGRVEFWELEYDGQKVSRRLYSVDEYVGENFVYEVQYMLSGELDTDMVSGYGGDAELAEKDGCIVYRSEAGSVDNEAVLIAGGELWEQFVGDISNRKASDFRLVVAKSDKIQVSDIEFDGEKFIVTAYNGELELETKTLYNYLVPIKCDSAGEKYTLWSLMLVEGYKTNADLLRPNESSAPKSTAANIRMSIFVEK